MAVIPLSLGFRTCDIKCVAARPMFVQSFPGSYGMRLISCLREIEMNPGMRFEAKKKSADLLSPQTSSDESNLLHDHAKEKLSTYIFRTDMGGHVKVLIRKKEKKYLVGIEVSSLKPSSSIDQLMLSWVTFRSKSLSGLPVEVPFSISGETFRVELEFEVASTPLTISFYLKSFQDNGGEAVEVKSHRKMNFVVPIGFNRGCPDPLGLSFMRDGSMNFAIFSRSVDGVSLCLFDKGKPALEIDLDPYVHRSGDIWHASIDSSVSAKWYGYRLTASDGHKIEKKRRPKWVLDPFAKMIDHGFGLLGNIPGFDWSGDIRHNFPLEKLAIYRLNVMQFTRDKSSKLPKGTAGSFAGIMEKLPHLKSMGVNAILLEPIFPFDSKMGPYFPIHFFCPTNSYGSTDPIATINSLKEMVRTLHANGIEVLMEVVFTHTSEWASFHEIDKSSYYCTHGGGYRPKSNALNCSYPIVQQMILEILRHWVIEFRIDGFCFVDASSLLRGFHGEKLSRPPLVESIAFDPVLAKTKLIADAWDPVDATIAEIKFPHWKRWAEMNSKFCVDVRNFMRGGGQIETLATRLCGSGDVFSDRRGPAFSVNYITRNSDITLVDLVSFNSEVSWNCGEEGASNNEVVLETRLKQTRNFLFVLFASLGVPVINMGDEYGLSSRGSREYHDQNLFNWDGLSTSFALQTTQFISYMSSLRARRGDIFQSSNFWAMENIDWHGNGDTPPRWDDRTCKFLAVKLKAGKSLNAEDSTVWGDLFLSFNAGDERETVVLPLQQEGMRWHRMVDTVLPYPGFFTNEGEPMPVGLETYEVGPHSCVLFEARRCGDC